MSLIYNSLKQHEKKADSQPKMNPMSQRMRAQERTFFSKTSFLIIVTVLASVLIVGLLVVQNYWGYLSEGEYVKSVNNLVLANQPNKVALNKENDLQNQQPKDVDVNVKANNQPTVKTTNEENNETKKVVTPEIKEKTLVAKSNDVIPKQKSQLTVASKEMVTEVSQPEISPKLATVPIQHNEEQMDAKAKSAKILTAKDKALKQPELIVLNDNVVNKSSHKKVEQEKLKVNEQVIEPMVESTKTAHVADLNSKQNINKIEVKPVQKTALASLKTKKLVIAKVVKKPKPILAKTVTKKRVVKPIVAVAKKGTPFKKIEVKAAKSNKIQTGKVVHKNTYEYFKSVKNKVTEIKQSIRLKNDKEVTTYLNELKQLSGKNSVIYQRMEAYAALKNQHYQAAANSYQQLLNQKPEDMEANMNLVIALAEMGDKKMAKQKLRRLDSMFPESSQLKQYKKMIYAKYGY